MCLAEFLLEEALGRSYHRHGGMPEAILADRVYDTEAMIERFAAGGIEMVIPARRNRKRERVIDKERYRNRNQVECFFNRITHICRVATRYEKTARNYLTMVLIAAMIV